MNYVFDSSALIYLGKLKLLDKIGMLHGKKFITKSVYSEVVKIGVERKEPEAGYINGLIKRKIFSVKSPKKLLDIPMLSQADNEVLSLAKEDGSIAIIDESYGKTVANQQKIESHGTIYLLLLLTKKIITKKEALGYLDKLVEFGFYLSINKYKEVLDLISNLRMD